MTIHYTAPRRWGRYPVQGTLFEQLSKESPRQRWIRERSEERYQRRAGHPRPALIVGELGSWNGPRIIKDVL